MNLATTYLGFDLPHPLVPGASPMVDNLDTVRQLEDAGAPMIVMRSLFEEQIIAEQLAAAAADYGDESYGEALSYLPHPAEFRLGVDAYLEQLRRVKAAVGIPVIGSLNGVSEGGWLDHARHIEQAGADGLELNLYDVATDAGVSGAAIEAQALRIAQAVKTAVAIPVAVKISPFYTSVSHFVGQLDAIGVDGVVLFNRFYQPDIDPEALEVLRVNLSSSDELLLRLRWLAILSGRVTTSLAASGGVHSAVDAIKAVMAGAHAVQMVSALLHHGPAHLAVVRDDLTRWLEEHEYESLSQMRGSLNLSRCDNPRAYERANYVRILQSWEA